jgi:trehalose 6-phosphate phosphatase
MGMLPLLDDWCAVAPRLRDARSIALFLDFDGTLAPLQEDPRAVGLNRSPRAALTRLAANPGVRVCIISGRGLADLRERVGVPGVCYLGVHGSDTPDVAFPPGVLRMVAEARGAVASRLNGHGGAIHIEDKGLAFSVHYRLAHPPEVTQARKILDQVVEESAGALWVVPGDRVWEVLPREIRGKGPATRKQWHLAPAGALPIYIGNDGTDEAAFSALAEGLTGRVGPARPTRARYLLRNPAEVARFLERLDELRS